MSEKRVTPGGGPRPVIEGADVTALPVPDAKDLIGIARDARNGDVRDREDRY